MIESTFFTTTAGATTYGFNNYKIEISKKGSTPAAPAATPTPAPATTPSPAPSATPAATPSAAPVAPAKQKPEEKYKSLFSTTVMSTTTSIVEGITRNNQIEHIYEKYASAYVESMSDQQLASAIERLDGIEYNFDEVEENNVITLKRV